MEFAKRLIPDWVTPDLSAVSFKFLNLTVGKVKTSFHLPSTTLRVSLQTSYRLRVGSSRVYTNRGTPKSRR